MMPIVPEKLYLHVKNGELHFKSCICTCKYVCSDIFLFVQQHFQEPLQTVFQDVFLNALWLHDMHLLFFADFVSCWLSFA